MWKECKNMRADTFSYLEHRLLMAFEASQWNDDFSRKFQSNELQSMRKHMRDMDGLERDIQSFIGKVYVLLKE